MGLDLLYFTIYFTCILYSLFINKYIIKSNVLRKNTFVVTSHIFTIEPFRRMIARIGVSLQIVLLFETCPVCVLLKLLTKLKSFTVISALTIFINSNFVRLWDIPLKTIEVINTAI